MDNNKASNVKVTAIFNGDEKTTTEWKKIFDPFKFDTLLTIIVKFIS
ncbi:unnamed protein product [Paramecium octaurelia]|uniref:Uncharacterized protein n=1 Tax=Paramecium octaurelia TaxID=43137 RepID=A0A8S1VP93_PAROT|nr:unnamed protein product [Paramecium octaurelia]